MFFKIRCYITFIISQKKIKISIEDEQEYIKMNKNMKLLYKSNYESKKEFIINLNYKTKIKIDKINYTNIDDLIGCEVYISGYSKYYNFKIDNDDEKIIQGYSLIANKIHDNRELI